MLSSGRPDRRRMSLRGEEVPMSGPMADLRLDDELPDLNGARLHSDALVFFGATGDLAYKKIFPALQAMAQRGQLDLPIIGVANASWTVDQLRQRARESLEHSKAGLDEQAFAKLAGL